MQERSPSEDLSRLVASLRSLHVREEESPRRRAIPASAPATSASPAVPRALIQTLRRVHESSGGRDAFRSQPPEELYDRVRDLFRERERGLRRESVFVDTLLARMRRDAQTPPDEAGLLQQDIRIAVAPGMRACADFVVVNDTVRELAIRFELGRPQGTIRLSEPIRISFSPEPLQLAPGQSARARARVDLSKTTAGECGRVEFPVDFRGESVHLGRSWLEINIVE